MSKSLLMDYVLVPKGLIKIIPISRCGTVTQEQRNLLFFFTVNLMAIIKYRVFISGIHLKLQAAECAWLILYNIIIKTLCAYNLEHYYCKY